MAKLGAGTTLVADRYAFSGAAFTAAQELRAPSGEACWDLDWCKVLLFELVQVTSGRLRWVQRKALICPGLIKLAAFTAAQELHAPSREACLDLDWCKVQPAWSI